MTTPVGDDDLKHVNPSFPKAAAGFTLLAGALGILTGGQVLLSVRIFVPAWAVVPYVLIALGAAQAVAARSVFTARVRGAIAAMGVGAVLAAVSAAWLVFAVSNGYLALYAIWTPVAAGLSVGLSAAALASCRRAEAVRARLQSEGLSLGL